MVTLYRIVSPYFVCGVIVKDNVVVKSAPIVYYFIDQYIDAVISKCRSKSWEIEKVSYDNHMLW